MLRIHEESGLPEACIPDIFVGKDPNKLFIEKTVLEIDGKITMMSFLKVTSEVFVLVDHKQGTPEERWEWMKELKLYMQQQAWKHGLDQMTAFIPPEVEESFGKRLLELGFLKSAYVPYTLVID